MNYIKKAFNDLTTCKLYSARGSSLWSQNLSVFFNAFQIGRVASAEFALHVTFTVFKIYD